MEASSRYSYFLGVFVVYAATIKDHYDFVVAQPLEQEHFAKIITEKTRKNILVKCYLYNRGLIVKVRLVMG